MIDIDLKYLVDDPAAVVERDKGVAFLVASRQIYQLSAVCYLGFNIPKQGNFVHCSFSDRRASQAVTPKPIDERRLQSVSSVTQKAECADDVCFRIESRNAAVAFFGYCRDPAQELDSLFEFNGNEIPVLASYFHNHILRRHGNDTSEALLVSARELDCLRWTAAGKSAWEASIILGISERTVRFHLNSAREKLNCTTTTQAVAKLVAQNLISI
jgi:DNA-binding CsgD family transcriptional regulator